MRALCLPLVATLSVLGASNARAEWWVQSPDDSCVERDVLVALIVDAVPLQVLAAGPQRTARIALSPEEGLISILVARDGVTLGERRLHTGSSDCSELTEAAVFVVATLIEGGVGLEATNETLPRHEGATQLARPSDAPRRESLESSEAGVESDVVNENSAAPIDEEAATNLDAPRANTRTDDSSDSLPAPLTRELMLAAGAAFRTGADPGFGLGPRLSLSVRLGLFRLALHGSYFRRDLDVEERRLVLNAGELGARLCVGHRQLQTWRLEGCGGVDVGVSSGEGLGFDTNAKTRLVSVGIVAEVGVRYTHRRLIARVSIGGGARLQRVRFTRQRGRESVDVFRQSTGSFLALLELGVRFDWSRG
ncbi:MAG: hypothetical protein ACI9KE_003193 [Polyangiales bacterium]|jgi:hypothetical protein